MTDQTPKPATDEEIEERLVCAGAEIGNQKYFDPVRAHIAALRVEVERLKAQVELEVFKSLTLRHVAPVLLQAEVDRLRDLIAAVSCNEATTRDCERYCSHGEDKLHAEGRAIRGRISHD